MKLAFEKEGNFNYLAIIGLALSIASLFSYFILGNDSVSQAKDKNHSFGIDTKIHDHTGEYADPFHDH
ncbi:MAG: hypothetical protein CMG75_06410 [Candidatus Marinimicrobia bacterium]|nr:hypothetical protein [Candidatus Neomarinimicrobiota bacterium]|tara:strand:- start:58 stop:261 length:204 start_codon:yes stop_codon:yes gene_type:complete